MELEATPYGQYPTDTRFRRPEYKFFKTVAHEAAMAEAVGPVPTPPIRWQRQQQRQLSRRPATAAPASGRQQQQQQQRQQQPREAEAGWRPEYPQPELAARPRTACSSSQRRTDSPAASSASTSLPEFDDGVSELATPQQQQQRPCAPPPPPPPVQVLQLQLHKHQQQQQQQQQHQQQQQQREAARRRPVSAAPSAGSLAVAEVVDFDESLDDQQQQQQQQQQALSSSCSRSSGSSRCLRPKTAPAKFLQQLQQQQQQQQQQQRGRSAAAGGLQILGTRMQLLQPDRQQAPRQAAAGVPELSAAYDRALQQHGWRMEVPGDPLGLKRHVLPERKPVSVSVPEPTVKPLPPRMRKTNRFTFFHTTIPRVVMSFDIHPSFTSEQYTKARSALMKEGKWDYSHRDFSFIY